MGSPLLAEVMAKISFGDMATYTVLQNGLNQNKQRILGREQ